MKPPEGGRGTSVRRIRRGEAALFRGIRLAALRESPSAFGSTHASALERSPESWREQADGSAEGRDRATFLAFAGDSPIGIAALYRDGGDDTGEVTQVWVDPDFRGRGIAVDVLDAVFRWAGDNGFRTVRATIAPGNEPALRLYRAYGFSPPRGEEVDSSREAVLSREVVAGGLSSRRGLPGR